ncbi:MAG: M15 family metallopeptidase [Flavitalea sp.]
MISSVLLRMIFVLTAYGFPSKITTGRPALQTTDGNDPIAVFVSCGDRWEMTKMFRLDSDSNFLKYRLKTVSSIAEYRALVIGDHNQELIALDKEIPGIALDIRYATSDNLMKQPVYRIAAAYMRAPAAKALKAIEGELNKKGVGLKIFDGYRPYAVTVKFYEQYHDTAFVASPYTGSKHNRGCAVDLTLLDLKTGKELKMPTPYDSFTKESNSNYPTSDAEALKNRELLKAMMLSHGFLTVADEWWHFDFAGWEKYPVMDISFELLIFNYATADYKLPGILLKKKLQYE